MQKKKNLQNGYCILSDFVRNLKCVYLVRESVPSMSTQKCLTATGCP